MAYNLHDDDCGFTIQAIDERKGRGLIATKDFLKGETIFREKPLVSCQVSFT